MPIMLWIAMAVLTAAASLSVLVPLSRQTRAGTINAGAARSIYRDQLEELARDRERGLIGGPEAEAARVEVGRRLLHADSAANAEPPSRTHRSSAALAFALVVLPLIAIGTYLFVGSPNLDDQPLSGRTAETPAGVADIVKQVETHLATAPDDGRGWDVIAPIYVRLGRFDDAIRAYGNANRLLGPTADRESLLGEALTEAANGNVGTDADAAFERALVLDAKNDRARFYRAIALGQQGRKDEAVAAWTALIADGPKDAAWLQVAEAERAKLTGTAATAPALPGPSGAEMADAAQKTPEQRQQMIEGMVSGLASRLDAAPADPAGWGQLFRAYMVLGRPGDAEAALVRARGKLAAKPDVLAEVEQAAHDTGVKKD
jgi:cytochrome c-type biogenesis protein CcmH